MSGTTLYLCEKPDQGNIVAKALGGGRRGSGGIEGDGWIVTWAFGHLLTPYMPEDYDPEQKRWSWETLPIVPKKFEFKPAAPSKAKQVSAIAAYMKKAGAVVISTDADREGELIAYEILNRLKWSGKTDRLWISDLTPEAVRKALSKLKPASETKPLYWAAAARTYADWIVGMNLSRAATLKYAERGAKPMSVGRVQTPVLALIVDLERKIVNFKPETYYEIKAQVATQAGRFVMRHAPSADERIIDASEARRRLSLVDGHKGPLSVSKERKTQGPPKLFDLNALQQDCNARFGWSADHALKVLQSLYETHNIVTYPRTDCAALPEDHVANIPKIAANLAGVADLAPIAGALGEPVVRKGIYNDKKVTAHHAIVPTNKAPDISALNADEARLYDLVARYWLAAHMPDMEYLQTRISMDAQGVKLTAGGRQILKPGWRAAFDGAAKAEGDEEDAGDEGTQTLPPVKDGDGGQVAEAALETKQTKPPARYSEKTLLRAMENIAAHVDDPAARKRLKDTSGIGTPATRASVIETLKARGYVKMKKRQIHPTDTAFTLIDKLRGIAPGYADPAMTAQWEDVLDDIATKGDEGLMKRFVQGVAQTVTQDVKRISDAEGGVDRTAPRRDTSKAGHIAGDWKTAIRDGTAMKVPYARKDEVKKLGARWDGDRKSWVIPKGIDPAPFQKAGFI